MMDQRDAGQRKKDNDDSDDGHVVLSKDAYHDLERSAIAKKIEDDVASSLRRRYTFLGVIIGILSLFGGYTLLTTSISTVVKEPLRREIDAAQDERIKLLSLRKEVEAQIKQLEDATKKANSAAQKATDEADRAQHRVENFLVGVDSKFAEVEEKFSEQTTKLTDNEERVVEISESASLIQGRLEETSNEILDAYRLVGEKERVLESGLK